MSNRTRGYDLRTRVHLFLTLRGVPVTRRPDVKRLADLANDDRPFSAFVAPGWALETVDRSTQRDLPRAVDQARRHAEADGRERFAVIFRRLPGPVSDGSVGDSFAVLPLSVLADVLADGQAPLRDK